MPHLRTQRDKRNVDTVALFQSEGRDDGHGRARLVYFFKSPAWVRIGRTALDAEARQTLAAQYPDVRFEWDRLKVPSLRPRGSDEGTL